MIIRHNPATANTNGGHISAAFLAIITVDAIAAFMKIFPNALRSNGSYITVFLLECMYHLTYALRDSNVNVDRSTAIRSFATSYRLMAKISRKVLKAQRALLTIRKIITGQNSDLFVSPNLSEIVDLISEEGEPMGIDRHNDSDVFENQNHSGYLSENRHKTSMVKDHMELELDDSNTPTTSLNEGSLDFFTNIDLPFLPDFLGFMNGNDQNILMDSQPQGFSVMRDIQ